MQKQIVFGDRLVEVELPDHTRILSSGVSTRLPPASDWESEFSNAMVNPIDMKPLVELARKKRSAVIAFDDATVPCYAPVWEPTINMAVGHLTKGGIDQPNINLICANALHRKFTNDELTRLIGPELMHAFDGRIECHDAENPDEMVSLGQSSKGFWVDLNRKAVEADLVVYLNFSTTRGFSGGWKSICVGLSSYRSIAHHHTPDLMSMSLDRNAMHDMLNDMGSHATATLGEERFFKVETVLSNPMQVAKVMGGSVNATRAAAVELNRNNMESRRGQLDEPLDVIVYGVPDWSPYAAFTYTNPLLTLVSTGLGYLGGMIEAAGKPGCTVILATPCPDRWDDARHPSYREVWERVFPTTLDAEEIRSKYEHEFAHREDLIEKYRHSYAFHGVHGVMAVYPLKRLRHAGQVIVAGAENPSLPKRLGFDNAVSVEAAINMAMDIHGRDCSFGLVDYPLGFNRQ